MARIGVSAAALAVAVWVVVGWILPAGVETSWAEMLRPVMQASGEAKAVHLTLDVRTRSTEDFDYVDLKADPQRVEAWILWPTGAGDSGKERVDSQGRVYCFDGRETIYYKPLTGEASRFQGKAPRMDLFWPAAWLQKLVDLPRQGVEVLAREDTAERGRLLLKMPGAPTPGRDPAWFEEFDREVEILWNPVTRQLSGFSRWVYDHGQRILYSQLVSVEYLGGLPEETFHLDLPADVRWIEVEAADPALNALGPEAAARRFWDAAIGGDWRVVSLFCPSPSLVDWLRSNQPQELVLVGSAYRSGSYAGEYVPCRVRLGGRSGGEVKEFRVALRNDNQYGRWVVDGGI